MNPSDAAADSFVNEAVGLCEFLHVHYTASA